jgi:tetratricopeptide (TPR) repeat protein
MAHDYLQRIQREFPHIRPYEEDDFEWVNEGLKLLENGKLVEAETKFKMLVLSQPHHTDGYEGLAKVYLQMKRKEEANFFIDLAIEKAKAAIASGEMDPEALDIFLEQKKNIDKLPK